LASPQLGAVTVPDCEAIGKGLTRSKLYGADGRGLDFSVDLCLQILGVRRQCGPDYDALVGEPANHSTREQRATIPNLEVLRPEIGDKVSGLVSNRGVDTNEFSACSKFLLWATRTEYRRPRQRDEQGDAQHSLNTGCARNASPWRSPESCVSPPRDAASV
jgi:hypothetical protein